MFKTNEINKVGIVAEYNPFHNGHIYQLNWIKENIKNPKIVVAMSHKYSQRGEIICLSYGERKRMIKKFGVSKVIPLKVKISSQAAHIFAREAVKKLHKEGIKYLVFGSETNDIQKFIEIANIIKNNEDKYNLLIKKYLKEKGNSFPRATNLALSELSGHEINQPNDILGLEYVKTIVNNNFDITPICIKRTVDFHSNETNGLFASATKLREMLKKNEDISSFSPFNKNSIRKSLLIENTYSKFQKIIKKLSPQKISRFHLVNEGIENLFKKNINEPDYNSFIKSCVSKRYTASRIKRTYLFVLLKIKKFEI
ncbi:nucleotidyltransferase [Mycoplasmopsis felis]|uniref:nucleotidyltransferase n=1 Tax=Mycoplasmopsis felis TaxID=33923 RepID=UPI002AFFDDD2|nr:nucleotidyltransferase [Mycoplasmopsis felis]WQQ06738.1 nucleotidyltransferase [Mycoplasmopsis felis]WRX06978.1 nucleotidyltransferase [Mycoplasmopsis felis]